LVDEFAARTFGPAGSARRSVVDSSVPGEHVARELDAIAERCGYRCMVVTDDDWRQKSSIRMATES